jgi:glycosyltransferase involved in cell wall biosynthesis
MTLAFSVILATRDRPGLFADALDSVISQDYPFFEIIVVNDGSSESAMVEYQQIWDKAKQTLGSRLSVLSLVYRPKGHGPGYSHNCGLELAKGDFICFLDDDDKWVDPQHLSRAAISITNKTDGGKQVDLYMTNQQAWINDKQVTGPVWLEGLAKELVARGKKADSNGCYEVTVSDLMSASGFCHMNCLTVRKTLLEQLGGMDESIRWEQDRDIYLRLIDHARMMLHHPCVTSFHRVPDPGKAVNLTTSVGMLEKRLLQIRVLDKAALFSRHFLIRAHAHRHKAYALKKISQELADKQEWETARYYAAQALGVAPGAKWLFFSLYCFIRSLRPRKKISDHD